MMRTIVTAPDLSGAALADLKHWLGITTSREDDLLTNLLETSIDMCEAFIGQLPLRATVRERLALKPGRLLVAAAPVHSILSLKLHGHDDSVSDPDPAQVQAEIGADQRAWVIVDHPPDARAIVVEMVAGIAQDWSVLPRGLRHGILRLAASEYRTRDTAAGSPVSVAALWQPWREARLS